MTAKGFYQHYWAHILRNAVRNGGRIYQDGDLQLNAGEAIGPVLEDFILNSVIKETDPCLLDPIQANYQLKMTAGYCLKDVKDDIFSYIPKFLQEIQEKESLHSVQAQTKTP